MNASQLLWMPLLILLCIIDFLRATVVSLPIALFRRWPLTIHQAVTRLIKELTPEDRALIRDMEEAKLDSLHWTLGMYIRNNYGLNAGNDLLRWLACVHSSKNLSSFLRQWTLGRLLCGPDSASSYIIKIAVKRLKENA